MEDEKEIVERSPFKKLLEEPSRVKVLDVLFRHSFAVLSLEEISESSGVDKEKVRDHLEYLEDREMLVKEECDDDVLRYRLNPKSHSVKGLQELHRHLTTG